MSTLLMDKSIRLDDSKKFLITALRSALNAAERNEDEITIFFEGSEITWNFVDGEFFVIG